MFLCNCHVGVPLRWSSLETRLIHIHAITYRDKMNCRVELESRDVRNALVICVYKHAHRRQKVGGRSSRTVWNDSGNKTNSFSRRERIMIRLWQLRVCADRLFSPLLSDRQPSWHHRVTKSRYISVLSVIPYIYISLQSGFIIIVIFSTFYIYRCVRVDISNFDVCMVDIN